MIDLISLIVASTSLVIAVLTNIRHSTCRVNKCMLCDLDTNKSELLTP